MTERVYPSGKHERTCPGYERDPHAAMMTRDQKLCTQCRIAQDKVARREYDRNHRAKKHGSKNLKRKSRSGNYMASDYGGF